MAIIKTYIENLLNANGEKILFSGREFLAIKNNHVFTLLHDENNKFRPGLEFDYKSDKFKIKNYSHDGLIGKIIT